MFALELRPSILDLLRLSPMLERPFRNDELGFTAGDAVSNHRWLKGLANGDTILKVTLA